MELLNYFNFDGINSRGYGVYISGEGTYNAPKRKVQKVEIPGRNGDLIIDDGSFENIPVRYRAFIGTGNREDFDSKLEELREELVSRPSYAKLWDTYHGDEFRLAAYLEGLEVEPVMNNRAGQFEIVFDCKPQRFLKIGEFPVTINSGDTIVNPTLFTSKPLIELTGAGSIIVGDLTINVTGDASQTIFIDSDIMDAYMDIDGARVSANDKVNLNSPDFPTLHPGGNGIIFNGLTSVKITPRWWKI